VYVHRVPFVVGPFEVEVPAWLGSWRNIGHQSSTAACTVAAKDDAAIMATTDKATANQILLFIFSTLRLSAVSLPRKSAKILFCCSLLIRFVERWNLNPAPSGDVTRKPPFLFVQTFPQDDSFSIFP